MFSVSIWNWFQISKIAQQWVEPNYFHLERKKRFSSKFLSWRRRQNGSLAALFLVEFNGCLAEEWEGGVDCPANSYKSAPAFRTETYQV